jgi:hypothetical protein
MKNKITKTRQIKRVINGGTNKNIQKNKASNEVEHQRQIVLSNYNVILKSMMT